MPSIDIRYVVITAVFGITLLFYSHIFITPVNLELSNTILADKIIINKNKREMVLFFNNKEIKHYKIVLGSNPIGSKTQAGDGKTPEGAYFISNKNERSSFHLSLKISYPNADDIAQANKRDVGDIMIHGLPNWLWFIGSLHLLKDWTAGCIAVTNDEIEEIWKLVPIGTMIIINQ